MKFPFFTRIMLVVLLGIATAYSLIGFQVDQTESVVITRFGKPVRIINEAGLHCKWPWPIESLHRVDLRLHFYEVRLSESLTSDKRNVIVPAFVAWRVSDPLHFLEALGDADNARDRLDSLVVSAKNAVLGSYAFRQLISTDPTEVKLSEIEEKIAALSMTEMGGSFGITISQIGIERITLPEANAAAVFERMRAERAQFAESYRAEGLRQADAIKAQADAKKTVLLAEANRDAEAERGKAEEEAAGIYAKAYGQDPSFYSFLRQIDNLRNTVNEKTSLILDANQPPFDLLHPETVAPSSGHP